MELIRFDKETQYIKDFVKLPQMIYSSSDNMEDPDTMKMILEERHPLSKYFKLAKFLVYDKGIKGRFITWYLILAGAVLMLSVAVGIVTAGVFGFVLFILGAASAYIFVMLLQDKSSDREFTIRLDARKYPRFYRLKPQPFRSMLDERKQK